MCAIEFAIGELILVLPHYQAAQSLKVAKWLFPFYLVIVIAIAVLSYSHSPIPLCVYLLRNVFIWPPSWKFNSTKLICIWMNWHTVNRSTINPNNRNSRWWFFFIKKSTIFSFFFLFWNPCVEWIWLFYMYHDGHSPRRTHST